jgi:hypothetical protein
MNTIQRLLQPLQHALQVFFARDLTLRRSESGVQLVLAERGPQGKPVFKPSRAELTQNKERSELALMQQQLAATLDELPETRAALRHLVFVEQALLRKGWRALHKLPLDVLQHALAQLEGLVVNWSPVGLANLRSKMAVAIIDREHMDPEAEADAYRTAMPMEAPERAGAAGSAGSEMAAVLGDDEALAAAYAAMGVGAPAQGAAPALTPAPAPAPTPAALALQALAQVQVQAGAAASGLASASASAAMPAGEALEFHSELGSPSSLASRASTSHQRENLAGLGKLGPIKLRELQG